MYEFFYKVTQRIHYFNKHFELKKNIQPCIPQWWGLLAKGQNSLTQIYLPPREQICWTFTFFSLRTECLCTKHTLKTPIHVRILIIVQSRSIQSVGDAFFHCRLLSVIRNQKQWCILKLHTLPYQRMITHLLVNSIKLYN